MRRGAQRNLLLAQRAPRAAGRGKSPLPDWMMNWVCSKSGQNVN